MTAANAALPSLLMLGLVLGMRHATDPDHVVAVTTIVTRERRLAVAARIGLFWGLGHTLTVFFVGAAIILFRVAIPARLGLAMEFAVAIVLILLGMPAVRQIALAALPAVWRTPEPGETLVVHSHRHRHGTLTHSHPHVHDAAGESIHDHVDEAHADHRLPLTTALAIRHPLTRSFGVGLIHGLAGSAAIALFVLAAIPDPLWGVLYLVVFGMGTLAGMVLITTMIGAPFAVASGRVTKLHDALAVASGLVSFAFGLFLAYRIGIVDGLLRASVSWKPQ
jgi:cytochrome c biogenesis protein CcdA